MNNLQNVYNKKRGQTEATNINMDKNKTHKLQWLARMCPTWLLALFAVLMVTPSVAYAGNIFYPTGQIFYYSGGQLIGDGTTPNSFPTGTAYRSNIDDQNKADSRVSFTVADGTYAAVYSWDVDSSAWTTSPSLGDDAIVVMETRNGLNGWTGDSWVGSARKTIDATDRAESQINFLDMTMEAIPTPTMQSNTTSSITIHWQGLWDTTTGDGTGTAHNAVIGYTVYRSSDGGTSYTSVGSATQNAGGDVAYTDSAVASGSTYNYKIGVRYLWAAHSTGYYEPTALSPASDALSAGVPQPVMLTYLSTAPSFAAGNTSAVQTVQSSDISGNAVSVTSDTTVDLTTNSSGTNAKFYSVSGGVCTTTQITSIVISTGTNTAQFCYYDEKAGSWTLTAASTGLTSATQTATVTGGGTLGSIAMSLTSPQKNRIAFTGTNTLTALDTYGNTMTDFSAASDAVTFTVAPTTATVGGLNGTNSAQLTLATDFTSGVANLTSKLQLAGTSGTYTITATTASGKTIDASVTLGGGALDHFDFTLASPQVIALPLLAQIL